MAGRIKDSKGPGLSLATPALEGYSMPLEYLHGEGCTRTQDIIHNISSTSFHPSITSEAMDLVSDLEPLTEAIADASASFITFMGKSLQLHSAPPPQTNQKSLEFSAENSNFRSTA